MTVGRDQQPFNPSTHSKRVDRWRGLGRSHTFALGIIVGTFIVAPLGAVLLDRFPPEPAPPPDPEIVLVSPSEDDAPEVTRAVEAIETATVAEVPANQIVSGQVEPNQFVVEILTAAGVSQVEADLTVRALVGHFDFRKSRPGHEYEVEIDPEGHVVRFRYKAAPDEIYVVRKTDAGYEGKQETVELSTEVVEVTGVIDVSLWDAFIQAGESPNLAMSLAEAFQFDIDFFHDTRKGDRFRFYVDKLTNEGELVRYGRIYAAEYIGSQASPVGTKRLFWFEGTKGRGRGYYDEKGKAAQRAFLRSPLKFTRISSSFGYRRHPILGRRHFHGGVDYAAPKGTPVQAVAEGRVTFAGDQGPAGNMVKIRHADGYESLYLHLSRILVRAGQRVSQSTIIGKVGSTGRSTGPHLDFRLKKGGRYINPRKNVAPRTKAVPKGAMGTFKASIVPWMQKLDST